MESAAAASETDDSAGAAIPLIELGDGGPVDLFRQERHGAAELVRLGRQQFGGPLVTTLDGISNSWGRRAKTPYRDEIAAIAADLPGGVWFMNLCFEWGCTVGVMDDPTAPGMRMLRTLDWPFHGLGRHLVVARQAGPAGAFYNLTWPAFVGVVQAMAPGRFALAINQAPLVRRLALPVQLDWAVNRAKVFSRRRIPPTHLLRRVAETCRNYAEARDMLAAEPIALPAIFSIVGTERGEGCVIERRERHATVFEAPAAAANHWLSPGATQARPRGVDSYRRHRLMNGFCRSHVIDFDWLTHPVVNPDTRLAMSANPRTGDLRVRGYEATGPATAPFDLALQNR